MRPSTGEGLYSSRIFVEHGPVRLDAQERRQPLARLLDGPDDAPAPFHLGHGVALALLGIGLQKVEDARLVDARPHDANAFRQAAREKIDAEALTAHQARERFAHRFQPLQTEGELSGKLLPGRPILRLLLLGQQQFRFEVGEPGGHHEIIGGDLQAKLAGGVDIGEILLGEVEDRNLGQIDFLVSGQHEQQVERAFEAVEFKKQDIGVVFGLDPLRASPQSASGQAAASCSTAFVTVAPRPILRLTFSAAL